MTKKNTHAKFERKWLKSSVKWCIRYVEGFVSTRSQTNVSFQNGMSRSIFQHSSLTFTNCIVPTDLVTINLWHLQIFQTNYYFWGGEGGGGIWQEERNGMKDCVTEQEFSFKKKAEFSIAMANYYVRCLCERNLHLNRRILCRILLK